MSATVSPTGVGDATVGQGRLLGWYDKKSEVAMRIYHLNCKVRTSDEVEQNPQFWEPYVGYWTCLACGVHLKRARPTYPPGDGVFYSFLNGDHYEEVALDTYIKRQVRA